MEEGKDEMVGIETTIPISSEVPDLHPIQFPSVPQSADQEKIQDLLKSIATQKPKQPFSPEKISSFEPSDSYNEKPSTLKNVLKLLLRFLTFGKYKGE